MTKTDVSEYPEGYKGRKTYVFVPGHGLVAACYTVAVGGVRQLDPAYGGPAIENKRTPGFQLMRDMGEYTSVVDGSHIGSRSEHREHIRRHDLIEVGNERIGSLDAPQDSGPRIGDSIKQALQSA